MVIKVLNLAKCLSKFKAIKDIDYTPEIVEATVKVERTAKDLVAVDTGTLRSSISRLIFNKTKENVFGLVYTPTEYAVYQEFGTKYQSGKAFMRPALNINRLGINQSMGKFLRDKMKQIVSK